MARQVPSSMQKYLTRFNPTDKKFDPTRIYLHMFPRVLTKQIPNLSPFSMKVETWFRLHNIKYEVTETLNYSSVTSQIPYAYHKGQEVPDSEFIMSYVEKLHSMDSTEGLQPYECGVSRAFTKMIEESTARTFFLHRYVYDYKNYSKIYSYSLRGLDMDKVSEAILERLKAAGIGRKTKEEVYKIASDDIRAVSALLGDKKFLLGDKITKVDCAVFGHLCQIVYVDFHYPQMDFIQKECPQLLPYMDRIKTQCWPDWDDIVDKGHFD